ncbi:DNA polymerase subunit alpha B [Colletotrichum sojae]|uniref:DNA polymerase alpha subunit B n=1 Tax=Colletotrichum sojae TaxID=2175907 RepID=A0A8H6JUB9_9PEZI|nr:DNA polymerase subunit alpha B [Colletotrichum sojae]
MSVSGTSMVSGSQAGVAKKPGPKVPPHLAIRCRTCGQLCDDEQHLMTHKLWAMKVNGDHIHCTICGMDFEALDTQKAHILEVSDSTTVEAWPPVLTDPFQMHPQEQDITCPGCQRRFVRLAGWMKHLEHNECPNIKRQDVDKNRAEKLTFAHELQKRSGLEFGDYFPASHPSVQSAPSIVSKPYMAHPSFFKPDDFPELKDLEGALQQDAAPKTSSASAYTTAPSSANSQEAQVVSKAPKIDDVNNPYHHRFDARKFYNNYSRKFKCPQKSCTKTFDTAPALVAHMKSSISHYNAKLQCPGCLRWFKDASSLTAHSESETNRCSIRHSDNYRVYLDQLTGGMADVVGKNDDKTIKYDVSTEAIIKFGPQQAKKATEYMMAKKEEERKQQWTNPVCPIMAEAEINGFFASGDKGIEPDVLSELQSIMRLHEISAEDLFYKWESFCIKMDMDATNPEIAHIRNFKKDIQDALEKNNRQQTHIKTEKRGHATPRAGKGGDVFGMLDGLMPSTPGSGRLSKQGSLRKKTHVTPTMSRVKAEIPSSSPDYKGPSKMEEQLNSMQPPSSFNDRQNAGETVEVLNDHLSAPEPPTCPYSEARIKLTAASDQKKLGYKPLAMKLSEASEILDDRIDEFMHTIQEYHKLDISEFGNAASQSTTAVVAVGRIASDAPEGKLNAASLVLELSRRMGGGQRVSLKMPAKGYSVFPGQIVALKGSNASGDVFVVDEVLEAPLLPNAASTPEALAAHREKLRGDPDAMDTDSDPAPLNVIYASGPYTADDNLDFEPLHALCDRAADTYADALVLTGPFIDSEHPLIATGDFDLPEEAVIDPDTATMSTVFKYLFSPALNRLVSANPSITILLVPSVRDVIDKHVSWPQDSVLRKELGLPKTARIVTNPMTLSINEMVMGISSQDILWQLKHEELVGGRPSDPSLLSRLSRYLLEQRHFFPLFPPTDRQKLPKTGTEEGLQPGAMLDLSYLKLGEMVNVRPDVLIVPSFLPPFAKVVESVLVINPGSLSKRRGAGTYARLTLFPPKVVATQSEAMMSHGIFDRARVEINRI